ncbi:SpoVR family protein [Halocalculus aciditolerans]|uniref:AbrB family transcriptional regulator n=1 Tax=Halocalculus aciditolerans TaxID=1383812 RepID=A0A830FBN4_9EURY|nr:SpoVR family protein [Halocalculus aciditolerans]GGL59042.1 AbrB family transcriptional regulator [Halocalculus aciditolerans]
MTREKTEIARTLETPARDARELAEKLGLRPCDVNYWVVDNDEMNELIAYDGFQTRYPHWRWGMKYDRQAKQNRFLGGKAFEIVNNDDPAHAFLQASNSMADQKAVITHVEAHADFFANNRWFREDGEQPNAAATLERHAQRIQRHLDDPDVERSELESFLDSALTIADCITPHRGTDPPGSETVETDDDLKERLGDLGLDSDVVDEVFDDEWLAGLDDDAERVAVPAEPEQDLLGFLRRFGQAYDGDAGRAVDYEDWQRDVLDVVREEAYYFAPQKLTKVMNEGWAALWESLMMGEEAFAGDDEFLDYADHQAKVLGSPGFNPYKVGKQLWEHVENTTNRREVLEHLLRVEGVTPATFHERVDIDAVLAALAPPAALDELSRERLHLLDDLPAAWVDAEGVEAAAAGEFDPADYPWRVLTSEGLAVRHYSLAKPQYAGVLRRVTRADLEEVHRYLFETDRYASVRDALAAVDRTAGWDRLFEVRASHNDVTFVDAFLTQEFVDANDYFAYEQSHATGQYHVSSVDADDVKKKLLLRLANFGKPTIKIYDANFENAGELRLGHEYNGVPMNLDRAERVVERLFDLWGRPVVLDTIAPVYDDRQVTLAQKTGGEPEADEVGLRIRYDGEEATREEVAWEVVADLAADDVDYDTKPAEWLA